MELRIQRVESESEEFIVENKDQEYTNPFSEVHKKANAAKDRMRETSKIDAELRESRVLLEAQKMLDPESK